MVFVYTLVGIAATVAICKEFEAFGGRDIRNIWQANENTKGALASACTATENDEKATEKLINALEAPHKAVVWRRSLVLAILITLMTVFLFKRQSERLFVVSVLINFMLIYVTHGYYNYHLYRVVSSLGKSNLETNFRLNTINK